MIVQIEKKKYENKGPLNTAIAYCLLLAGLGLGREIGAYLWPETIDNKVLFYFVAVMTITIVAQFISFALFLPGYLNLSPIFEKYQINKRTKWPWERPDWKEVRRKTIMNFILNELMIAPLFLFATTHNGIKYRFTEFPSLSELCLQMVLVYMIEDSLFYWAHRMVHVYPQLYRFHKVHHEYDKVYTFATEYFHPIDYVIGNLVPLS